MMRLVLIAGLAALTASQAQAAACREHEALKAAAKAQYDEAPVARYVTPKGTMIEVLASPGGSVTVIEVFPRRGTERAACVVSTGESWQTETPLPGRGA
jgi:opacity protein-like surface antigen